MLTNQENITVEQVKKILSEEEEGSSDSSQQCSSEDEDIFEETAQVSPPRGREKRQWRTRVPSLSTQPVSGVDWAWLIKRLHKLCMDLCNNYIQMHLDLESVVEEQPPLRAPDALFFLPLFPSETSTPSTGGYSGRGTPSEDGFRLHLADTPSEEVHSPSVAGTTLPQLRGDRKGAEASRKKEWWESAGNKLYTIATDKTITKLMIEYKKRKQQHNHTVFTKEVKVGEKRAEAVTLRGPDSPGPQRPQHLMEQGPMRHSVSAGPELLRQDKRPRSGSTASSHNISLRDSEAQIQVGADMFTDAVKYQWKELWAFQK